MRIKGIRIPRVHFASIFMGFEKLREKIKSRKQPAAGKAPQAKREPAPAPPAVPKLIAPQVPARTEFTDKGDGIPRSARAKKAWLAERERCAAIVRHGMSRGCTHLACDLAFKTEMTAAVAIEMMQNIQAMAEHDRGRRRQ